jgi:PhnB protein
VGDGSRPGVGGRTGGLEATASASHGPVDGAPFFLHQVNPDNPAERSPAQAGVTSTRIEVFVEDPDSFLRRAVAAGASLGAEIQDHQTPWGTHRQGGFHDPFGHNWSVGDRSPLRALPS